MTNEASYQIGRVPGGWEWIVYRDQEVYDEGIAPTEKEALILAEHHIEDIQEERQNPSQFQIVEAPSGFVADEPALYRITMNPNGDETRFLEELRVVEPELYEALEEAAGDSESITPMLKRNPGREVYPRQITPGELPDWKQDHQMRTPQFTTAPNPRRARLEHTQAHQIWDYLAMPDRDRWLRAAGYKQRNNAYKRWAELGPAPKEKLIDAYDEVFGTPGDRSPIQHLPRIPRRNTPPEPQGMSGPYDALAAETLQETGSYGAVEEALRQHGAAEEEIRGLINQLTAQPYSIRYNGEVPPWTSRDSRLDESFQLMVDSIEAEGGTVNQTAIGQWADLIEEKTGHRPDEDRYLKMATMTYGTDQVQRKSNPLNFLRLVQQSVEWFIVGKISGDIIPSLYKRRTQ